MTDNPVPPVTRQLVTRGLLAHLEALLAEEPVIVLNGPRTVGKSTLMQGIAATAGRAVLDFDDDPTLQAVRLDPGLYAAGPAPVLVDEFQKLPELLNAIKAELNQDLRPGRFILTGSTRYSALPRIAQSLTGRVHIVDVWPFTQREFDDEPGNFCETLLTEPRSLVSAEPSTTTRSDYERRTLAGGLPLAALRRSPVARARWFNDYVQLVIDRDVLEIREIRQRTVLPRILRAVAAQTGGIFQATHVAERLQLDHRLVGDYVTLMESVFLLQRLPAWGRTLSSRVAAAPKMHVVDSGLAAHLLALSQTRLAARDPVIMTEFGHVLESFAVQEVIRQGGWLAEPLEFGHYRTHDQSEVDLVIETYDGRVAAVEVKASARLGDKDLRGLLELRAKLGRDFVGGVVLNTGTRSYTADDRIHILPMDRLWAPIAQAA